MTTNWTPTRDCQPPEFGYYLVTCAPKNHADIDLDRSASWAREFTGLGWYNPSNGWWLQRPGSHGRSDNETHRVTHWSERPAGAELAAEDLAALPRPRWAPSHADILREISDRLLFGHHAKALELVTEQLLPHINEQLTRGKR